MHGQIALCHCAGVTLSQAQRDHVAANYDGCLCNGCLIEIRDTVGLPADTPKSIQKG